jgi:hypothetical protein
MLTEPLRTYMAIEAALRAGDLEAVRAAFGDTPGFPNVRDPLTWTHLLSLAIHWSPAPLVAQLLDLGADPNFEAPDGFPAVYGALSHDRPDRIDLMRLLLARGADPSARRDQRLHAAPPRRQPVRRSRREAAALARRRPLAPDPYRLLRHADRGSRADGERRGRQDAQRVAVTRLTGC